MTNIATQESTPTTSRTGTWTLDPAHSLAELRVRHMMIATVRGSVNVTRGTIRFDEAAPENTVVEAELDAASIQTGAAERDAHLRSPDFLDAASHPTLRFRSRRVVPRDDATYDVEGDLTIRGVTRPITLRAEIDGETTDPWGNRRIALTATTTIDRTQWGLTWNMALETGGILVADKVAITLNVQATG